jgi:hypothetical protein
VDMDVGAHLLAPGVQGHDHPWLFPFASFAPLR